MGKSPIIPSGLIAPGRASPGLVYT